MSIGTSLGAYYPDEFSFQARDFQTEDNSVITPETTPDLDVQDNIEIPSKPLPAKEIPVSDIEDRRNFGILDELGTVTSGQIRDKLSAILENPLPGTATQTLTAREPIIETPLGDQLGLQDIK